MLWEAEGTQPPPLLTEPALPHSSCPFLHEYMFLSFPTLPMRLSPREGRLSPQVPSIPPLLTACSSSAFNIMNE